MNLDVRLPICLMFAVLGLVLSVFGLASDPAIYKRSLNLNVNLWWGLVLLLFGVIMLFLGWRGRCSTPTPPPEQGRADQGGEAAH
jgi:multisubunit Na+/H+ antiporter MnhG subunit